MRSSRLVRILMLVTIGGFVPLFLYQRLLSWEESTTTAAISSFPKSGPLQNFHSYVTFVFVMGLEGTGHHLISALADKAPATEWLRRAGIHPNMTFELGLTLTDDDTYDGLWNVHCKTTGSMTAIGGTSSTKKSLNPYLVQRAKIAGIGRLLSSSLPVSSASNITYSHSVTVGETTTTTLANSTVKQPRDLQATINHRGNIEPDVTTLMDRVVHAMRHIEDMARTYHETEQSVTPSTAKTLLVNTWDSSSIPGWDRVGQGSFPTFKGDCRKLNYANLDLWYEACTLARVDCRHVFLYRDPYAILKSTTARRRFNPTMLSAIHLYTSHLSVIMALLAAHPDKTIGCWGLLDASPLSSKNDEDLPGGWTNFYQLLGWDTHQEFQDTLAPIYHPSRTNNSMSDEEKKQVVSDKLAPYLRSFYRRHEATIALCQQEVSLLLGGNRW